MITEIDKETINFLSTKRITFNQFCICILIYNNQITEIIQYTDRVGYLSGGSFITPNKKVVKELDDLLARGFLEFIGRELTPERKEQIDNFKVTDKFLKGWVEKVSLYKMYAKAFWTAYPNEILIRGFPSPVAKVIHYNEFEELYKTIVNNDVVLHTKIMGHLMQSKIKTGGYASMKIDNYLNSKQWDNVIPEQNQSPIY